MRKFEEKIAGARVLITGHSGFTGAWASFWLNQLGCQVGGLSLPPHTNPSLFSALKVSDFTDSTFANIDELQNCTDKINQFKPDIVLHLAAQALVRESYLDPVGTFQTNVMGTVNVLHACEQCDSVKAVVCVTTDKVYLNNEWAWPYRENDPLGGKDPYSASKSAAEMAIASWVNSNRSDNLSIAVARGGNIIGGGDWSADRLVPDFVRAVTTNERIRLRYPDATRPWQHVLALVQGYLMLSAGLLSETPERYARPWNFGPVDPNDYSVRAILELLSKSWKTPDIVYESNPLPEARALALDSSQALNQLNWHPAWDTPTSVLKTSEWYRDFYNDPSQAIECTNAQIHEWRQSISQE